MLWDFFSFPIEFLSVFPIDWSMEKIYGTDELWPDEIIKLFLSIQLVHLRTDMSHCILLHHLFNCTSTGSRAADGGGGGGSNYFDGCVRYTHSALGGETRHLHFLRNSELR
jgi:hypothetical protein